MKTIAIDFDGPIFAIYWDNDDPMLGYKPFVTGSLVKGVKDAIAKLKAKGYRIVIHTSRVSDHELNRGYSQKQLVDIVKNKLDENGIAYDEIWTGSGKPAADFYVDDKAVYFQNWERALREVE